MEQNQQEEKLGFFRRMILAITDFRLYPFIQTEKVYVAVSYFTLFVMLVTTFLTIHINNFFFEIVDETLNGYNEKVPDFVFSGGKLDYSNTIYNLDSENKYVIDTSMSNMEFLGTNIGKEMMYSKQFVVVNNDGIIYGDDQSDVPALIQFNVIKGSIDKNGLYSFLKDINENNITKLTIFVTTWILLFAIYYISKTIRALFLILITWILSLSFRIKLKFGNLYRIVVYALTLPLLMEMVTIMYLNRLPEQIMFLCQLVTYVYIFYALRSIEFASLITNFSKQNLKEKIENTIQKLEKELEEQREQKEKQEDDDEKKDDKDEDNK